MINEETYTVVILHKDDQNAIKPGVVFTDFQKAFTAFNDAVTVYGGVGYAQPRFPKPIRFAGGTTDVELWVIKRTNQTN